MILNRIEQLERSIQRSTKLDDDRKVDLLNQLAALRTEAASLPQPRELTPSTAEVIDADDGPIESGIRELAASVEGLETSHPKLTEMANRIGMALSNMGI